MTEHLKKYWNERFGYEVIDSESGFVAFAVAQNGAHLQMVIQEFFIDPDFRLNPKRAMENLNAAVDEALKRGCTQLGSFIQLKAKNSEHVLKIQLKYGFRVVSADAGTLGLIKELK